MTFHRRRTVSKVYRPNLDDGHRLRVDSIRNARTGFLGYLPPIIVIRLGVRRSTHGQLTSAHVAARDYCGRKPLNKFGN